MANGLASPHSRILDVIGSPCARLFIDRRRQKMRGSKQLFGSIVDLRPSQLSLQRPTWHPNSALAQKVSAYNNIFYDFEA